jgi:hypothetical protein
MNHISTPDNHEQNGTLPDGSMILSRSQVEAFGNGDAARGRKEVRRMANAYRDRAVHNGPTPQPRNVRAASQKDEVAVMELLLGNLREYADQVAPIDPDRVALHVQKATRRDGGLCGVIDGPDGKPVAVCLLVPVQWWWSQQWYLMEVVNYVHPDHRRSHHIDDLLSFQRWAVDAWTGSFGYRVYLLCGVLGAWRVFEKIALYRRRFRQAGSCFIYPAPNVKIDP